MSLAHHLEASVTPTHDKTTEQILARLSEVVSAIDLLKKLYEEKDQLTLMLLERVGTDTEVQSGDRIFKVVDNFANKNIVFKPTAFKRFELEVDSEIARKIRALKGVVNATEKPKGE